MAGAVVQSREQGGISARRQRRRYARLESVGRRETGGRQFRGLSRVILPVVIEDEQRSVVVAQLQGWIGERVRHTKAARLGPMPRTTILSLPLLLPRMKPAMTMSSPVLTKARVLMLASFAGTA